MIKAYRSACNKGFHSAYIGQGSVLNPAAQLLADAVSWQSSDSLFPIAGAPESIWGSPTEVGWSHTMIMPRFAARRKGTIKKVVVATARTPQSIKLKVFRYSYLTSLYAFISEVNVPITLTNETETIILPVPIDVAYGDIVGVYHPTGWQYRQVVTDQIINRRTVTSDVVSDNAFTTSSTSGNAAMEFYGTRPYLALVGDSIGAGLNAGESLYWVSANNSVLNKIAIPGGSDINAFKSEPLYYAKKMIGDALSYENVSISAKTMQWGADTGVGLAIAKDPKIIVVSLGANDAINNIAWSTVEANLDSIKTQFDNSDAETLYVSEVTPHTNDNTSMAVYIRTFNSNLSTWCTSNSVPLILCHDAMGQIRAATGELDDLKTEYDYDGTHLTQAGAEALGEIVGQFLIDNQ